MFVKEWFNSFPNDRSSFLWVLWLGLYLHLGHRDYGVAHTQPLTGRGPGVSRWNVLAQSYSQYLVVISVQGSLLLSETEVPGPLTSQRAGSQSSQKELRGGTDKLSQGRFTKFGNWVEGWKSLQFLVLNVHQQANKKKCNSYFRVNPWKRGCSVFIFMPEKLFYDADFSGKWWFCVEIVLHVGNRTSEAIFWNTGIKENSKKPPNKTSSSQPSLLNCFKSELGWPVSRDKQK